MIEPKVLVSAVCLPEERVNEDELQDHTIEAAKPFPHWPWRAIQRRGNLKGDTKPK